MASALDKLHIHVHDGMVTGTYETVRLSDIQRLQVEFTQGLISTTLRLIAYGTFGRAVLAESKTRINPFTAVVGRQEKNLVIRYTDARLELAQLLQIAHASE